ncbi:hypothetical protein INT45_001034 [Circinella minor]|uniref:Uncharacterized protein n=1 Tax=Circinella minor TaxID=1195481 RepID=A0A8H7VPM4_9FUNG|nr:hypothetical protein INT45_001034 [Circinella minor]
MLYDQQVAFRKPFKVGEQVLMRDKIPQGKFGDKWLGPMVQLLVLAKKAFIENHTMVPDVQVKRTMNQYQAWIDRRRED